MHIEPGLVTGTRAILGFAAAAAAGGYALTLGWHALREKGLAPRCMIATAAVFAFFEIFPHYPVGVSEVHLILGSTLFLILGAAPATAGLALGLLI
ncbi:cobalt transporter, partial [Candidatus Falkowbacteria bacterium]|nr:cobalt transporter [Candidatus Falkowbacteria bacterium]